MQLVGSDVFFFLAETPLVRPFRKIRGIPYN